MAKRSNVFTDGGTFTVVEKKATVSEERVAIRSQVDAKLLVAGSVSGERYEFPRAGAEVKVDVRDVDELLKKVRKGCCGAPDFRYFELV